MRHADTQKDPDLNAALWVLSDLGKRQAIEVSEEPIMNRVDIIFSSEEKKAFLTAEPIAHKLKKEIIQSDYFNEVKRGDKFLTKEEFENEKKLQLEDLSYNAFGGESCIEALARFEKGVNEILQKFQGKIILIVTHGTILNVYFANILKVGSEELKARWKNTDFCAYGIIEDGLVVKDII